MDTSTCASPSASVIASHAQHGVAIYGSGKGFVTLTQRTASQAIPLSNLGECFGKVSDEIMREMDARLIKIIGICDYQEVAVK